MKENLVISEKFTSIQGEGQTMGVPAIFIRLAGCNLLCKSASWVCDSIEVWQKGTATPFDEILTGQDIFDLRNNTHLIFTGGEPLLHQKKIAAFIDWIQKNYGFTPTIEVETNGTIVPSNDMLLYVGYWNCSPKLANSGEPFHKRVNPDAIMCLGNQARVIFKFVISAALDVIEISNDYGAFINHKNIVLMPAGETQEKLIETRKTVIELCLEWKFRYSDRLHIIIWNKKTGV